MTSTLKLPELIQIICRSTAGQADPFAGWDSVPLFMKSLPEDLGGQAKGDGEEASGDTLAALQALVYEGEPTGAQLPSFFCPTRS